MVKNKFLLTAILNLVISILNGQSITSSDLVGSWLFGKDKRPIEVIFNTDSSFNFYDNIDINGRYSISKVANEYVLYLSTNTVGTTWTKKIYLICIGDSSYFKLQIPQKNENGDTIYKWQKHAKGNIYILSRIDTSKPEEPVQ